MDKHCQYTNRRVMMTSSGWTEHHARRFYSGIGTGAGYAIAFAVIAAIAAVAKAYGF